MKQNIIKKLDGRAKELEKDDASDNKACNDTVFNYFFFEDALGDQIDLEQIKHVLTDSEVRERLE